MTQDSQPAPLSPGHDDGSPRTVAGYRITSELGRGAAGIVLGAVDPASGRPVAIKILRAGGETSGDRRARFEREGLALARLRHPNVVSVHAAGVDAGRPYLVLDLVAGDPLSAHVAQGAFTPERAATIALALCGALAHVHARGILHRDIKPSNVLVTRDGVPLLTDFGLARDLDLAGTRLSMSGRFLGTPGYWPPEQAAGRIDQIDARSDLYALGATLYAMLTGGPPFQGATVVELVIAAESQPAQPASKTNPDVPAALDAICLRCLAKRRDERYPDAESLAADLEEFLRTGQAPGATDRALRDRVRGHARRGARVLGLLAPLVAAGGALVWVATRPPPPVAVEPSPSVPKPARWVPVGEAPKTGALPGTAALALARRRAENGALAEARESYEIALTEMGPSDRRRVEIEGEFAEVLDSYVQELLLGGKVSDDLCDVVRRAWELRPSAPRKANYLAILMARANALRQEKGAAAALTLYREATALDPTDVSARTRCGEMLYLLERDEEAAPLFDQALALDPDHPKALFRSAQTEVRLKRYGRALPRALRAAALLPRDPNAQWVAFDLLTRQRRFKEAIPVGLKAVRLGYEPHDVLLTVAEHQLEIGDAAGALETVKEAEASKSENKGRTDAIRGRALALVGDAPGAIKALEKARQRLGTSSPQIDFAMGLAALSGRDSERAIKEFTKCIERKYRHAESLVGRAKAHRRLVWKDAGVHGAALQRDCAQARRIDRTNVDAYLVPAHYLSSWGGHFSPTHAVRLATQVLRFDPSNLDALEERCRALENADPHPRMLLTDAEALIRLAPKRLGGWIARAAYWAQREEFARALPDLDRAVKLQPKDPYLANRRGLVLAGLLKHNAALAEFKRAHDALPENVPVVVNLCDTLRRLGRTEEALRLLDDALQREPENTDALVARGGVRESAGDVHGALSDLRAALSREVLKPRPRHPLKELRRRIAELEARRAVRK